MHPAHCQEADVMSHDPEEKTRRDPDGQDIADGDGTRSNESIESGGEEEVTEHDSDPSRSDERRDPSGDVEGARDPLDGA